MFTPKIRFIVMSDVHVKPEKDCKELERLKKGLASAYKYAESCDYNKIDAFFVVGDFANRGAEQEMLNFKEVTDTYLKPETDMTIALASHEYHGEGEEAAKEKLKRIFGMHYDAHKVINGFHFISVSSTRGCEFDEPQVEFAQQALEQAAEDAPEAPIFFFQHPHITDTVSGSIYWADDALYATLMNYPQVIDFSGHSHAPVNDPRSIHQKHFTAHGTGSLSYFELDEFDKYYGTVPPDSQNCAQFLIVEADDENRVRIMPYDILTDNFFPCIREIEKPCEPDTFVYTDERYLTTVKPHFSENAKAWTEASEEGLKITFNQAKIEEDYVNDYKVVVRDENNRIVRQLAVWSSYYLYNMPETVSVLVKNLKPGKYSAKITASGFWNNKSDNALAVEFTV